ncbi:hypothetical protein WJX72_005929 [[Myrmecia] bisecta]|uniref:DNA annealing helicase and endonuclease ZRANB3 n=1 Tax=[Myrmecia] bisecta TaxID=41462 RepID=A0AAW1PX32_9CHLO
MEWPDEDRWDTLLPEDWDAMPQNTPQMPHCAPQMTEGAVHKTQQRTALCNIQQRICQFREQLHRMPPRPPAHDRCPGVYKRGEHGCGGALRYVAAEEGPGFWGCSTWPECAYREDEAPRLLNPHVAMEVVSRSTFKVGPAQGAEDIVAFCGGTLALFALVNQQRHRLELTDTRHYSGLIPEATLSAFRGTAAAREAPEEVQRRYACLPAYLQAALLPFQREGVRYALERRGRVLIADEMGVGKTVQAIALSSCYQDEWPMLVIVPASLRLVWAEELEKWLPHLRPCHIHVIEGKTDRLQGQDLPQVVITSYEMMSRLTCDACRGGSVAGAPRMECTGPEHCMAAKGWAVVIADESHTLRTTNHAPDARHTEAVCSAAQRAKRAIFLSGTPSLTRPFDLFRQVDAIRPGLLGFSREAFAQRYCNRRLVACGRRGEDRKRWDNSGLARAGELHSLLKQEVMLRRMKREVLSQLPPKRRQVVRLPRPRPQDWPKEGKAKSAADGEDTSGSESEGEEAAPVGMEAASPKDEPEQEQRLSKDHCTGIAKLPNVIEWLMHALGGRESGGAAGSAESRGAAGVGGSAPAEAPPKFLIFAHHRTVMSRLASALEGNSSDWAGIAYVRIEGATDPVERRLAVQRFRDDPSVRVALLSVTAAGTGLDFSAASAVVFAELPRDAEDRAHRQGQRFPVNVYFLVARGTSDDRRWQHLNRSLERVSAVHDAADGADARGLAVDRVCTINGKGDWDRLDAAGNAGHNISDKADGGAAQASARRMAGLAEASLLADGSQAAEVSGSEEGAPKVWFEVSANTNRVHFHSKPNGSAPLGLSLPLELLQMPGTPATLADLLQALDNRPQVAVHVGPAGVLALQPHISRADVEAWVADAREFAAEWVEMRSVFQSKLFGQVLRHPLQDAVEEANAKAQKAGAYGSGTDRYLTGDRSETPLPEGASWQTVRVKYARYGQEVAYKQAFSAGNQRLCVCCLAPVLNCSAPPPAVLHSAVDLFCGPACEARFCMRSGGGALRRAVFRLERGVCTLCKLDCHDLVQRLRTIEKGSHKWEEKRRQRVAKLAPNFCKPGFKAYLDRLVKQALPGNAWHADHIVAVYQGGGLCDLENLRTLCVICHQGVTKAQARERAEARRMRNQSTLDAFLTLSQRQRHQQQPASKPRAKGQAVPLRRPKRAKVARTSTSDSDSDFCQVVAEVAAPPRPAPAAESAKSGQDRDGADQRTGEAANGSSGGGTTAMGGGKSREGMRDVFSA